VLVAVGLVLALVSCGSDDDPYKPTTQADKPVVVFETSMGNIAVELYPLNAPVTVSNFLRYVREGFYESLTFHRVIDNFIIQGGAYDQNMQRRPAHDPIPNEADNGLWNVPGSIAMARAAAPHSATSQFFINMRNNPTLNFQSEESNRWGYCVFGSVIEGMDVVDEIERVDTATRDGHNNVPVNPVVFVKVYLRN
jgi:peptidyl-prolyl cis-trans isomerase B (cyclophilin B)